MSAEGNLTAQLLSGASLLLTGVLSFIGVRLHNRVDKLEEESKKDAKDAGERVTRAELLQHIDLMRSERVRMHEQNYGLLQQIFTSIQLQANNQSAVAEKARRNEADIDAMNRRLDAMKGAER